MDTQSATRDEAFKMIVAGYRKKRQKETHKCALLVAVGLMPFIAISIWLYTESGRGVWPLVYGVLLAALFWKVFYEEYARTKNEELQKLRYWEDHPDEAHHTDELFEYGFYELALKGYDDNLAKRFEEARKREEELSRFFEEYRTMPRFVDGFPRPIPDFKNHDLWIFEHHLTGRAKCLSKLGRESEAEAEIARCRVIRKIGEESRELTEKYWNFSELD